MLSPNYLVDTTDSAFNHDKIKRVSSVSSISSLSHSSLINLSTISYGSVYTKVWERLCALENDPYPGVIDMAKKVTDYIRSQVKESAPKEATEKMPCSSSLPPSPSNRTSYLSNKESPPTANSATPELFRSSRSHISSRPRKPVPSTISEETDDIYNTKSPLVVSQFVEWSCAQFAQPVVLSVEAESTNDVESRAHHEREWRYLRNKSQRMDVKDEHTKIESGRIDLQIFHTRSSQAPEILLFHPFDPHLAVGCKDYFGIWDWQSGAKLTYHLSRGNKASKISSLQFINSHDVTLLMAGSDDGTIRIWKNYFNALGRPPTLLTAWQALNDLQPVVKNFTAVSDMVTSWEQRSLTLAVSGGDAKFVRLWDVETERLIHDISTG